MPEASSDKTIPVRVALRVRPLVPKELGEACQECIRVTPGEPQIVMGSNKAFTYDFVLGQLSKQSELYKQAVAPLLSGFLRGYNATVLAYGQTGSGKTYSMGTSFTVCTSENEECQGVIPRLIRDLFRHIEKEKEQSEFMLKVSFLEIHNEEINDLLNPSNGSEDRIAVREDCDGGIKISGLQEITVTSAEEMVQSLENGSASRATAATAMNSTSSRSHAIYTIIMEQRAKAGDGEIRKAKFHLVDLAGSERVKRTNAQGERFKEGVNINKGLLSLGNVISALSEELRKSNAHVPYRDSKLTRLLQDSLGGNSNTVMIACVSPADSNYEETLNTLRYADRARQIKNKPIINRDPAAAEMARLKQQVQMLQLQLLQGQTINGSLPEGIGSESGVNIQERADRIKELETENEKLCHELHDSVDQNTHLYEKVLLLELSRDKMIRTFEDIKQQTAGSQASIDTLSLEGVQQDSLAVELQKKFHELERTMHAPAALEDQNQSQEDIQVHSHDGEPMDQDNSSRPSSPMDTKFDSQHALRQAELGRQVQELSKALEMKQELAHKMIHNEGAMNSKMIKQYEETVRELESEIDKLEKQKTELASALAAVKSSVNPDGGVKARNRIKELESKIVELKKKQVEQQKLHRLKQQSDSTITKLNSEIQSMKSMRVKLMRQMKEESERFRNLKKEKEKEIYQLKDQGRKRQFEYNKLQTIHKKQQAVLKRKTEEATAANKRLKDALQKRKEAADKRVGQQQQQNKQSDGILPKMKSWLGHEVEVLVSVHHAKRTLEEMIEDRKILSEQLSELRGQQQDMDDQPPAKKMLPMRGDFSEVKEPPKLQARITALEMEMKLRSSQVAELQQKILDAEHVSGEKSKHRWNNIHTMAEAKAGLQALLQMTIDAKLKEISLENQLLATGNDLKELRSFSETSFKRQEGEVERIRRGNDETLATLQREHEDKVRILLQQIPTEDQKEKEAKLRKQIAFQQKRLEELWGLNEELRLLQEKDEGLKKQVSDMMNVLDNDTLPPDEMDQEIAPTPHNILQSSVIAIEGIEAVVYSEEEEEGQHPDNNYDPSDDLAKDPDWVKTPIFRSRISSSKLLAQNEDPAKRDSNSNEENGCSCKGKCKLSKSCRCKRTGELCGAECKCKLGKCANRPKDPMTPLLFDSSTDSEISTHESQTKNEITEKPSLEERQVLVDEDNENIPRKKKSKLVSKFTPYKGRENKVPGSKPPMSWRTPNRQQPSDTDGGRKIRRKSQKVVLSKKYGLKARNASRTFMSPHRTVLTTPGSGFTPQTVAAPKSVSKPQKPGSPKRAKKPDKSRKRKLHNPSSLPVLLS